VSRIGGQSSPFGVTLPKAGKALRFRLRRATMRRIGETRRANVLERRSVPRSRLRGESGVALPRFRFTLKWNGRSKAHNFDGILSAFEKGSLLASIFTSFRL